MRRVPGEEPTILLPRKTVVNALRPVSWLLDHSPNRAFQNHLVPWQMRRVSPVTVAGAAPVFNRLPVSPA